MILIFPQCHSHLNGDAAALPHAEHDRAEAALAKVLQVRDGIETTLLWGIIQLCSEYSQQMRCEIFILKMGSVICIRLTETSETSRADRLYHDSAASMNVISHTFQWKLIGTSQHLIISSEVHKLTTSLNRVPGALSSPDC